MILISEKRVTPQLQVEQAVINTCFVPQYEALLALRHYTREKPVRAHLPGEMESVWWSRAQGVECLAH